MAVLSSMGCHIPFTFHVTHIRKGLWKVGIEVFIALSKL